MSDQKADAALAVRGLDIGYRDAPVLRDLSFTLRAGEILAIVGHNGSGKTTLVKTLLGISPPLRGTLDWVGGRPAAIAYLGQLTDFDRRFPIRVRDLAAMGAWRGMGWRKSADARQRRLVARALEQTNIAAIAEKPIHELSSGQLQRALFARTIVQDAPVILLDEPFAAVDQATETDLLALIDGWAAEGRAVAVVLHDLSSVLQHAGRALLLGGGVARFGDPKTVLTPANLIAQSYFSAPQLRWLEDMMRDAERADA